MLAWPHDGWDRHSGRHAYPCQSIGFINFYGGECQMAWFMADSSPLVHSHNVTREHERVYAVTDVGGVCNTPLASLFFMYTHTHQQQECSKNGWEFFWGKVRARFLTNQGWKSASWNGRACTVLLTISAWPFVPYHRDSRIKKKGKMQVYARLSDYVAEWRPPNDFESG